MGRYTRKGDYKEVCEHAKDLSNLEVVVFQGNYSKFAPGSSSTFHPSQWSLVRCKVCQASWRTKAKYVYTLKGLSPPTPRPLITRSEGAPYPVPYSQVRPRKRPEPCPCDCHLKDDRASTNPMYGKMKRLGCAGRSEGDGNEGTQCASCGRYGDARFFETPKDIAASGELPAPTSSSQRPGKE